MRCARSISLRSSRRPNPAGSRNPLQLTGLSITMPCQSSGSPVFVAYGDTDVVTLGQSLQPVAMIFEQVGGAWKLANIVQRPSVSSRWPALCRQGTAPTAHSVLAPGSYAPELARALNHAATGTPETAAMAAPFAVNSFLSGPGSFTAQSATQTRQDRAGGIALTERFSPSRRPATRPAASRRTRILADRRPHPDRHLQLRRGHPEGHLSRRRLYRHHQTGRRAPRDRHLHHDLHGGRSALLGERNGRPRRILRLAADSPR